MKKMIINLFKIIYINKYYYNMDILIGKIESKEEITKGTLLKLFKSNKELKKIAMHSSFDIYILLKKYNINITFEEFELVTNGNLGTLRKNFQYLLKIEHIYKRMINYYIEIEVKYLEYNVDEFIKIMEIKNRYYEIYSNLNTRNYCLFTYNVAISKSKIEIKMNRKEFKNIFLEKKYELYKHKSIELTGEKNDI